MMQNLLFTIVLLGNTLLFGQTGILKGRITDGETGEEIPFANIQMEKGKELVKVVSDIQGNYCIKSLSPGKYELKISSLGYENMEINSVRIAENKTTYQDVEATSSIMELTCCEIVYYEKPLIDCNCCSCCTLSCLCYYTTGIVESDSSETTSKKEAPVQVSAIAYPNPFTERVTIKITSSDSFPDKKVKLFDLTGKEVKSVDITETQAVIERENLSPGIYFYQISSENKTIATGKLEVIQ